MEAIPQNGTPATPDGEPSRGPGLSEPILLDPHRLKEDMRLIHRAVKWGWKTPRDKRDDMADRLFEIVQKREVAVVNRKGEVVYVDGPADENSIQAARTIVAMVGQNIDLEREDEPKQQVAPNVTVNVGVQVVESDDWYGTRAATNGHVAQGNETPANCAAESGPVQGGGVRPSLGQNGNGSNGHAEGPRSDEGPAAGSD